MSMVSACTAWQTQENTLDQISTLNNMRYSQLLTNLSDAIDQKDDPIPSSGVVSSGTATTVATGGLAFTLTQPFAFTNNTKTLTPSATLNWQNNWTITPVSDPQDLQNLRSLYGLLLRTDSQIAQFVMNTLTLYAAKKDGSVNVNYMAAQQQKCGISWSPYEITNPDAAAQSYFGAWNAFPAPSFTPTKEISPTTDTSEQSVCYSIYGVLGQPLGQAGNSLAAQYGLLYPRKDVVLAALRNGLSPDCRSYQINYLLVDDPENPGQKKFRHDTLFERWLFWRDANGSWAPYAPPSAPGYLGKYGNHDFWTTSTACLADFVVLAINSTANSHAAAQNASKPTGTTAAASGQ